MGVTTCCSVALSLFQLLFGRSFSCHLALALPDSGHVWKPDSSALNMRFGFSNSSKAFSSIKYSLRDWCQLLMSFSDTLARAVEIPSACFSVISGCRLQNNVTHFLPGWLFWMASLSHRHLIFFSQFLYGISFYRYSLLSTCNDIFHLKIFFVFCEIRPIFLLLELCLLLLSECYGARRNVVQLLWFGTVPFALQW